jgi:hypothetical protein
VHFSIQLLSIQPSQNTPTSHDYYTHHHRQYNTSEHSHPEGYLMLGGLWNKAHSSGGTELRSCVSCLRWLSSLIFCVAGGQVRQADRWARCTSLQRLGGPGQSLGWTWSVGSCSPNSASSGAQLQQPKPLHPTSGKMVLILQEEHDLPGVMTVPAQRPGCMLHMQVTASVQEA